MTQTEIFSFVVQTLYWFFLYGCIGWGVEVVYAAIKERRLVNRGFLCGPICPIYGCGMVVLNRKLDYRKNSKAKCKII